MKFISVEQARGLEIGKPTFTLDGNGSYGFGRLVKIEQTIDKVVRTFELATFAENGKPPSINPTVSTTITHVAVIKPQSNGTQD